MSHNKKLYELWTYVVIADLGSKAKSLYVRGFHSICYKAELKRSHNVYRIKTIGRTGVDGRSVHGLAESQSLILHNNIPM